MKRKSKVTPAPAGYNLGRILFVLRASRGWKQQNLARAAGIQPSTLCAYEQGKTLPALETLTRLLEALGFPLAALDLARSFLATLDEGGWVGTAVTPWDRRGDGDLSAEVRALSSELSRALERLHRLEGRLGASPVQELRPVEEEDRCERVEALWADLNQQPYARQQHLVVTDLAFRSRRLCERLCWESERQASRKPKKALLLGQLAVQLADRIGREEGRATYLRSLAGAHVANALRADGKLPAADALFDEVRQLWNEAASLGEPPQGYEVRILDLESSYLRDQRSLPAAMELIDRALALETDLANRGRLLIKKSKIVEEQGDLAQALSLLQEAEPLVDPAVDLRLVLCLHHNRADYLSKLGRFEEAEALLPGVRKLSRKLNNELDLVRLHWLEARVEAGLGRTERAIQLLNGVRGDFAAREIDYDTALVTLELAALLAQEGRTAEVKALARHLVPLFTAQKVHREALAALALFRQAAEREHVTAGLARDLLEFLLRARHDPSLRFEALSGLAAGGAVS